MERIFVGFVGPIASGKGTATSVFTVKGYQTYSLSDRVREEAKRRVAAGKLHADFDRTDLQDIGDELRAIYGGHELASRTWALATHASCNAIVIDSIRNPEEIRFLRTIPGWKLLIGVDATPERRFQNMRRRNRPTDPQTWEEFLTMEKRDRGAGEKALGQQVDACLALADCVIQNNGTRNEFLAAVRALKEEHGL